MDLLTEPALSSGEVGDLQDSDFELALIDPDDPARTFRNEAEFMIKFTADSSTAYKMTSAIYSAKVSFLFVSFPLPRQS